MNRNPKPNPAPPPAPDCSAHHPLIACGVTVSHGLLYVSAAAFAALTLAAWIF